MAQYAVYDANSRGEYHWSTDHGDSGSEMSSAQALISARTVLRKHGGPTQDGSDDQVPIRREVAATTREEAHAADREVCGGAESARPVRGQFLAFNTVAPRAFRALRSRPTRDRSLVR